MFFWINHLLHDPSTSIWSSSQSTEEEDPPESPSRAGEEETRWNYNDYDLVFTVIDHVVDYLADHLVDHLVNHVVDIVDDHNL